MVAMQVLKVIGDWMPSGLNGLAVVVGLYACGLLMRHLSGLLLTIYTRRFHVYKQQFVSPRAHMLSPSAGCVTDTPWLHDV
jgi:hypothetical protein